MAKHKKEEKHHKKAKLGHNAMHEHEHEHKHKMHKHKKKK